MLHFSPQILVFPQEAGVFLLVQCYTTENVNSCQSACFCSLLSLSHKLLGVLVGFIHGKFLLSSQHKSVILRAGGECIFIREMRGMRHRNIISLVQRHHWASCTVAFQGYTQVILVSLTVAHCLSCLYLSEAKSPTTRVTGQSVFLGILGKIRENE